MSTRSSGAIPGLFFAYFCPPVLVSDFREEGPAVRLARSRMAEGDEKMEPGGERTAPEGPSRMRILHVVPRLANSSGPTHITIALAEAQARAGHQVKIMTVTRAGEWTRLPDQSLVTVESFRQSWQLRNFCYSRGFGKAIGTEVEDADVVHIHTIWTYPTWKTMDACRQQGVPYVVAPQGSFESWALGRSKWLKIPYGFLVEGPLYDRAARFQALTETEARQCQSYGVKAPTVVIPNPVDVEAIDRVDVSGEARRQLKVGAEEQVILFLGRIFPKKGLELLAEAMVRILEVRKDVVLCVAGSDAGTGYARKVKEGFARAGVGERVRFAGELYGEHKIRVLKEANVFVLPSYSEGLPVAVLEAMAAGVATVITPGCNLPEVVERDAGWMADADPMALAEAILAALSDTESRSHKVERARALVSEKFSSEAVAKCMLEVYGEIRAGSGAGHSRGTAQETLGQAGRRILRWSLWLSSLALGVLVLVLSWATDSRMRLIRWLPAWLSAWADAGGERETMRTAFPLFLAGVVFSLSFRGSGRRCWPLLGMLSCAGLVLAAEGGQLFLENRAADWADVGWGMAGAASGVGIAVTLILLLRRTRRHLSQEF